MNKHNSKVLEEGFLAGILALFSFGKQVKMLQRMYTASKDPEIQELIHDIKFNEQRYKDEIRRLKKKHPNVK
jgi:hypothetical protein